MADPVVLKAPVSYSGPDGDNQTWEPPNHCPESWPETIMGSNRCGVVPPAPAGVNYDRDAKPADGHDRIG